MLVMMVVLLSVTGLAFARYEHDPNDFASEVVRYDIGNGLYSNGAPYDILYGFYDKPATALGPPTVLTAVDANTFEPVNPVYPACRANEIVSVGDPCFAGQEIALVLKFNHRVAHDQNNPYGIDFIVFGNARFYVDGLQGYWPIGGDPTLFHVIYGLFEEPGIVSVSQDGVTWYTYSGPQAPRADSFAPTASYRWDYSAGRWGQELDPTRPIDPNLKTSNFLGLTVAEAVDLYDGSAGGAGFDIAIFGLDWIQYVKITSTSMTSPTPEVDAVADVSACGDYRHPFPAGDLNYDCRVDFKDLAVLSARWLGNAADLSPIAQNWLACTWECN
jgi:hypothetical protein